MDKVNMFLGGLVELNAEDLYRYKGLLAIEGMDERIVFQVSIVAWPASVQCRLASHHMPRSRQLLRKACLCSDACECVFL